MQTDESLKVKNNDEQLQNTHTEMFADQQYQQAENFSIQAWDPTNT